MAKQATVDEFIQSLSGGLPAVAEATRRVIDVRLEGAESAIKWAHPTWSLGKQPVCYLKGASKHIAFGFWHGTSIEDPSGRLETSGSVMAQAKLRSLDDVDDELFAGWLRQARVLELDGS